MKLLIDEMYPPAIAQQLRGRKHDVDAVAERPDLRALPDTDIFALAQREQRAVVTENLADFNPIADAYDRRGRAHHGLVLVTPRSYPRGNPRTIGRMVTALDRLLDAQPEATTTSARYWL